MGTQARRRRQGTLLVVAGVLLLAATGVAAATRGADRPLSDAGSVPTSVPSSAVPTAPLPGAPAVSASRPPGTDGRPGPAAATQPAFVDIAADRSFRPTTLRVPAIGVTAPVVPTRVGKGGALGVPEDPREVGWWSGGAAPGSPYGTTLLAGHVDSATRGLGSLVDLSQTPVGARVRVEGLGGTSQDYTVVARRSYPKATMPTRELFRQDVPARLLLITCGGRFDRGSGHYERNVVVFAVPAATGRAATAGGAGR